MSAGAELLAGPRGTDVRLEAEGGRKTRDERRADFHARKDAQTAARDRAGAGARRRALAPWPTRTEPDAGHRASGLRRTVGEGHRLVVKVGSSSLTSGRRRPPRPRRARRARRRAGARAGAAGHQVVLVSSGAIAAGIGPLGLPRRPSDLATQQAAA